MSTMTHKIHAGRRLAGARGGEDYVIWGHQNSKHDYSHIGFPQDLRNCAKCHSSDPKLTSTPTPQGDNWKTKVSKEACLTCHANNRGSDWYGTHSTYAGGGDPQAMSNQQCWACHNPASNPSLSPERVHWNQNAENSALYKMNIESVVFNDTANHKARTVTVKYFLSDPTNGDATYNLVTADCAAGPVCSGDTKFGNLRLYLAYQNVVGQLAGVTEFSAYGNGGDVANAYAYKGANDGNNHYTVDIPLPDDSAIAVASGTARVISSGQIKEVKLQTKSAADPRPPVVPTELINVPAQHTYKDVVLSGPLQPRRQIVADEKCGVCHGSLGTTTGSNDVTLAIHAGARTTVASCTLCHDANRIYSNLTVMTNGLEMSESYQFKRMIHGIHGNSKRTHPFTHGNTVIGEFGKDNLLGPAGGFKVGAVVNAPDSALFSPYAGDTFVAAGTPLGGPGVINYAAEVNWPGVGVNCNACHVNNSYQVDLGTLGAAIAKPIVGRLPPKSEDPDPNTWRVLSPRAASCTGCHTSSTAIGHVTSFGGASFGNKTQGEIALLPRETCNDCHAPGSFMGVDVVHGLK
jgi:OmcA/MtrC family decaheme c-type cytochrome